jgi:hypothetical protein
LDRVFISRSWNLQYPDAGVLHLPTLGSDHNLKLLQLEWKQKRRSSVWRLGAKLSLREDYQAMVEKGWKGGEDGANLMIWERGEKLAGELKTWHSRLDVN